jgi:hydrogenase nickel incorporation protein HypB
VVLLSATEGEGKPLEYPTVFNSAGPCAITRMDLAAAVESDRTVTRRNIGEVSPGVEIIETSARAGARMDEWLERVKAVALAASER